ncbi:hypothetical protein CTZ27_16335 [Streptomyces griseocarneus]|nr:hypothetical protein CTZ27_16335 [Streptomyces griseocarneus]
MSLSYHDVITADLSPLSTASEAWQKMGERFGELKTAYEKNIQGALANGNWQGQAFDAHQLRTRATGAEYAAAKTEALAVASLLKQAHTLLTRLQKAVKDLVTDAEAKEYKVDAEGKATYIGFEKLSSKDQATLRHDPDYPTIQAQAAKGAQEWTDAIAKAVESVNEADEGVQRALGRASTAMPLDGKDWGGFNARAESDLAKAGAPEAAKAAKKKSGWTTDGEMKVSGPDAGFSVTGPAYGKEGTLKGYLDLFHVTQKGSASKGDVKLSGISDIYAGARATANAGITDSGISGQAEVSAGIRSTTEGRVEIGPDSFYGRHTAFAGGEAGVSAKAGKDGVSVGAKAFAGGKSGGAGGIEVGGIGIGATAEGWWGPGAEAKWGVEKQEDGKYHIGAKVGLSPVVGGAVGLEFTVDPNKVADSVGEAAHALGDAAGKAGHAIGSATSAITHLL